MTDPFDRSPDDLAGPAGTAPSAPEAAPGADDAAAARPDPPPASAVPEPPAPRRRRPGALQLAIAAVAVMGGMALFLSGFSLGARTATTPGTPAEQEALFAPFWDTWDSITKSYVGEVDKEKLVQGAIDGLIGALDDPYSSYMSPEELQRARESIGGEFSGIGAEVTAEPTEAGVDSCDTIGPTCRLVVVAPIDGSPAERAGIRSGDVITAVDGATVDGETLEEAIARVRGPKGTPVVITIARDGGEPFDLRIVRDTIVSRQVDSRELAGGDVTYIRLSGFSDNSAKQFEAALREARDQGVTKFVIDLRDNPGGYVTAARAIASQFIADGPVFWEEAADGSQVPTNAAAGGAATDEGIRVAVLVNGGSASASEIVAGALQDTGRGTLVGETTFGKGTIQQWVDLTAESGGFRLSIAKWLTPDKRWIHETGLEPDVKVTPDGPAAGEPGPTGDPYIDAALDALGEGGEAALPSASPTPAP